MKKILTIISLGLMMAAMSCTKEESTQNEKGFGTISIDMALEDQTRTVTDDELRSSASVKIYKADFSGLVRSYTYSEMPSSLYLVADNYRVDVEAGEAVKAAPATASWDSKSYKGSKEFQIVAGQTQTVQVEAKVNNAVSCISFDQTVADNFNQGYTFTINVDGDETRQLVYDASKSGAEGYFIVAGLVEPSFNWTFTGTLAKDGSAFTKTGTIKNILPGKLYKMNLKYTVKDGDLVFTLMVDYSTDNIDDTIIFEPVSTGLAASSPFEIWAKRATVHADVDPSESEGKTIQFAYSSNGTNWSTVDGVSDGEGAWKAVLTGLNPATKYSYKLMIDGAQVGDPLEFTTEAAPNLPNASFEYVSLVKDGGYYKFYDPACSVEEGKTKFWGSGNGEGSEGVNGSANMGIVITYIDTEDKVDGKQSVRAQTSQLAGILAAGNLFVGQFSGLVGTSGGKVNFGRPWTTRPTAMKLYCKYLTGPMDIIGKTLPPGVSLSNSDYDRAEIKFALGTWDYKKYGGSPASPVHINTTDASTFVDYNTDESTIANGNLIIYHDGYSLNGADKVDANTGVWIEYTIPLNYHDVQAIPTHMIVSCAASRYGDYFTGCSSSKLWIDAVELIY